MYDRYSSKVTRVLDENVLRATAPSIFAAHAASDRSERYTFIPTADVVRGLMGEGWMPVFANESVARKEEKKGYTKHLVRFRHQRDLTGVELEVGDIFPELVLTNSHDGTSGYKLHAGLYRKVCSNGLIVGDSKITAQAFRHSGDVVGRVIEGAYEVVEDLPEALETIKEWQGVNLAVTERVAFAESAATLKWDDPKAAGVRPDKLLVPARPGDRKSDLWTTFNVVQENILKGGVRGFKYDDRGRPSRVTTRAVKAVAENVRLNKALWELSEKMAALKA